VLPTLVELAIGLVSFSPLWQKLPHRHDGEQHHLTSGDIPTGILRFAETSRARCSLTVTGHMSQPRGSRHDSAPGA
jgi:hypothetical protein